MANTAEGEVDGFKVVVEYRPGMGNEISVYNPDGSVLARGPSGAYVLSAIALARKEAKAAGNQEQASLLLNLSYDLPAERARLEQEIKDSQNAEAPPPGNEPTPPATTTEQTTQQNSQFEKSGGADDDSGKSTASDNDSGTTESQAAQESNNSEQENNLATFTSVSSNAGTTVAGKSGTKSADTKKSKPGKRPKNPLGDFSSYTYQISLYMVTPEVYNEFVSNGRKNINSYFKPGSSTSGVYLVCQSGGINNSVANRAPGFELDYYIDNLSIESTAGGKDSGGAFNATEVKFTIVEPYSFSLIKKLKKAMDKIQSQSTLPGLKELPSASRNFFMLGIRFLGYDADGNLLTAENNFERFYDITLTEMKFKIDGRMVTYHCTANVVGTQAGYGVKLGRTKNDLTVTASTVQDAINGDSNKISGLLTQLNSQQEDMKKAGQLEIANKYNVVFLGAGGEVIANSSVVNLASDNDKSRMPASNAKTSDDVSEAGSLKTTPVNTYKNIVFKADTPILQCIQLIISQSTYIQDALSSFYTSDIEPDRQTDSPDEVVTNSNKKLTYYNVSSSTKILGYDTILNDFAYEVTYVVEPYQIPVVQAVSANATIPYYGPAKRYDYWYTGENKEILHYEQSFDNLYFIAAVGGDSKDTTTANTPVAPNIRQNSARQGTLGAGAEAENAVTNFLMDPQSQSEAKITILGDPDFLMYPNTDNDNASYDPFYGKDGYTISPNGGQIFIEIDFKEAIDYDHGTGVMSINDNISFYEYPPAMKKIVKGVVYLVTNVKSEFKSGKFIQTLELKMPDFGSGTSTDSVQTDGRANAFNDPRSTLNEGGPNQANPTGTTASGLVKDPTVNAKKDKNDTATPETYTDAWYDSGSTEQQTSPTGGNEDENNPVADDDSNGDNVVSPPDDSKDSGREDTVVTDMRVDHTKWAVTYAV